MFSLSKAIFNGECLLHLTHEDYFFNSGAELDPEFSAGFIPIPCQSLRN
jgi:hypothetical protein